MFGKHITILAYPAHAAAHCPAPLQHRCAVHKAPAIYLAYIVFDILQQLIELVPDDKVLVGSVSVFGYVWGIELLLLRREVIEH